MRFVSGSLTHTRVGFTIFFVAMLAACSGGGGGGGGTSTPPTSSASGTQTASPGPTATTFALSESPMWSRNFVDSMGVHVDTVNNLPSPNVAPVAMLVKQMGVRHVRIPIVASTPYAATVAAFLSGSGAKALGIAGCSEPLGETATSAVMSSDITTFQNAVGGALEGVEAVNEPDSRASADPNWVADTISCMQTQVGALPSLPYLAPSLQYPLTAAPELGSVANMVSAGNIHRYFSGHSPNNPGYGGNYPCGVANSLPWAICEAQIVSGNQPMYVTESGYNSDSEVDLPTQAKYLSRVYFVNANAGIVRTYLYCMVGYTGEDGFGGEGLLEPKTLAPKPAYYAISSLTSAIDDPSTISAVLSTVKYSLTGPASLEHLLMRKRDGTYVLALWNETESWNPATDTEVAVPAQNVTIKLPFAASNVSGEALNDSGAFAASTVSADSSSTKLTVPVDDHITLVFFLNNS